MHISKQQHYTKISGVCGQSRERLPWFSEAANLSCARLSEQTDIKPSQLANGSEVLDVFVKGGAGGLDIRLQEELRKGAARDESCGDE